MDRIELGPVGGARYYVRRPDWRRAGQLVTARVGLAVVIAGAWVGGAEALHAVFAGFVGVGQ